jgi:hypothetical protein
MSQDRWLSVMEGCCAGGAVSVLFMLVPGCLWAGVASLVVFVALWCVAAYMEGRSS